MLCKQWNFICLQKKWGCDAHRKLMELETIMSGDMSQTQEVK